MTHNCSQYFQIQEYLLSAFEENNRFNTVRATHFDNVIVVHDVQLLLRELEMVKPLRYTV